MEVDASRRVEEPGAHGRQAADGSPEKQSAEIAAPTPELGRAANHAEDKPRAANRRGNAMPANDQAPRSREPTRQHTIATNMMNAEPAQHRQTRQ